MSNDLQQKTLELLQKKLGAMVEGTNITQEEIFESMTENELKAIEKLGGLNVATAVLNLAGIPHGNVESD